MKRKRLIAFMMAAALSLTAFMYMDSQEEVHAEGEAAITFGDVNGNGSVNVEDALAILMHIAGKEPAAYNEAAADCDEDGKVTVNDALQILMKLAGKRPIMPAECTHQYNEGTLIKKATVYEEGKISYVCSVCGKRMLETVARMEPCASCTWDEGVTLTKATYFNKGSKSHTCTVCGKKDTVEIPMVIKPDVEARYVKVAPDDANFDEVCKKYKYIHCYEKFDENWTPVFTGYYYPETTGWVQAWVDRAAYLLVPDEDTTLLSDTVREQLDAYSLQWCRGMITEEELTGLVRAYFKEIGCPAADYTIVSASSFETSNFVSSPHRYSGDYIYEKVFYDKEQDLSMRYSVMIDDDTFNVLVPGNGPHIH